MVDVCDYLTPVRDKMLSIVTEQDMVKNVATQEECILVWLKRSGFQTI